MMISNTGGQQPHRDDDGVPGVLLQAADIDQLGGCLRWDLPIKPLMVSHWKGFIGLYLSEYSTTTCVKLQIVKAPGYKKHVLLVEGKPFLFTEKYHNLFKGHKTSWNMRSKKYLHYSLESPMRPLYKIDISTLKNSTSPGISEELLTQQKVCVVVCGLFAVLWLIMAPEAAGRGWPQRYIKWG